MKSIVFLLIIKFLWRIPAALMFMMPLAAPVIAYSSGEWFWLALVLINPVLFARRIPMAPEHMGQDQIQRYRLPKCMSWMETPDEHLPGGMYEPTVKWVYDRLGWFICSMYWILIRNVGGSILWGKAVFVGPIYPKHIDFNNSDTLKAVREQTLIDMGLTPEKVGIFTVRWELTKDFYGTKSGRVDSDWRTCDYVAKPELSLRNLNI